MRSIFSKNLISIGYRHLFPASFCSKISRTIINREKEGVANIKAYSNQFNIQIVDDDNWRISSGLFRAWQESEAKFTSEEGVYSRSCHDDIHRDITDIDDMRIRGNLFFKLDRDSKEYEEYTFDFHRKKDNSKHQTKQTLTDNSKRETRNEFTIPKTNYVSCIEKKKKLRTPTYNQLTGPYHEPFCLDIYVSKGSVRACIVHRLSSKVVAVAHSISKDMKFDLVSSRDFKACEAVGEVLARRAIADDIHDIIYTPRRGERIEGKLQVVLQSVINGGINVKVKIKQRRQMKAFHPSIHGAKITSKNQIFR